MSYGNDDLEFLNEPRVLSANGVPNHEGEHYVTGVALLKTGLPNDLYLRNDGRWYISIFGGGSTGYFRSATEAERALALVHSTLKRHAAFEDNLDRMEAVRRFEAGLYAST